MSLFNAKSSPKVAAIANAFKKPPKSSETSNSGPSHESYDALVRKNRALQAELAQMRKAGGEPAAFALELEQATGFPKRFVNSHEAVEFFATAYNNAFGSEASVLEPGESPLKDLAAWRRRELGL